MPNIFSKLNKRRSASRAVLTALIGFSTLLSCSSIEHAFAAESKNPKANFYLRQAEQASHNLDHAKLLEACAKALENDPKLARAYSLRAKSFMQRRRWDKAITNADQAISLDPKEAMAYVVRGKSGYLSGSASNDQIVRDFETAVRIDPNIEDGAFYLGIMCTVNKQYERSLHWLTKAQQLEPKDKNVYHYRSACYSLMGKSDLALKDLDTMTKLDPRAYEAFATKADTYARLKQYDKAITEYTAAIKIRPREYALRNMRAAVYIKMGKHEEAIKDYTEAININPIDEDLFLRRGNEYVELKDFAKALEDYNEAISLEPDYETAYVRRSVLYTMMGKPALAAKDRAKAAELKKRPAEKKI